MNDILPVSLHLYKFFYFKQEIRCSRGEGWCLGVMIDDKRSRISLIFRPKQLFRLTIYTSKVHRIYIFKNDKAIVE